MNRITTFFTATFLFVAALLAPAQSTLPGLQKYHRIVFVGDSITYAGGYIDDVKAYLVTHYPGASITLLNLGQSSETVSGLSEPGHAGGKYLRPDLHVRLGDILVKTDPDLIVADYGMNDGIYQPLDEARFQKYKDGMAWLHEQAMQYGADILHVTPSPFDPHPIAQKLSADGARGYAAPYTNYNDTLDHYSAWLVSQRAHGWDVVDIHTPMNEYLASHRQTNADFALTRDGVHPGAVGHWLMARELLLHWGAPKEIAACDSAEAMLSANPHGPEILQLATQEENVLRDAWLTETGHLTPGHKAGPPLADAQKQAADMEAKLQSLAAKPETK